ncbi:unnamed protein product [Closterium sp. NIES-53]
MQLQWCQRGSLPPQQLREWYANRSGGGGSSGSRCLAVQLGFYGGGLAQMQRHLRETLTPQQLREWYAQRGVSRSSARCPYAIRTGARAGQTCGTVGRTQSRCFSCLSDTWRAEFGDAAELPRWLELIRQGVDIFALDCDAILTAMYALTIGTEGISSLCVLPDPGEEAATIGASESALPGTAPRCFTLPCPFLHYSPVSGGSVRLTVRSSPPLVLYELGLVAPPCSCRLLSHQTLLWHHRLGHPSLSCLRDMHSRLLVSGLPRSLPPLPPSPAPPCLPCVEGWQRAAPHSLFPPTTAPLQTLHMDVWGPARVSGQGRECYFLLVVDDYTRYTTVFPLRSKGEDLPILCLHSDRGGEFSSDLLRDLLETKDGVYEY